MPNSKLLQVAASVWIVAAVSSVSAQERAPREDPAAPRSGKTGNYIDGYREERPEDRGQPDTRSRYGPPPLKTAPKKKTEGDDSFKAAPRPEHYAPSPDDGGYSENEILNAGHRFFGAISVGLAKVVAYAFQRSGRPNGYILGEDVGGAFVAGLRYGEGVLYTKYLGSHKVYWQGPSLGYDFGAEGSKTLVLVYNLQDPFEIYNRFAGVQGSAYFVGGIGIQFQTHENVILAPIRAGVGVRLGANIGYLKYTRTRTWNPF
ncbi:MAG: DUF1134 domain-containing protein [Hyphomicrobiaceae bacterium]